MSKKVAVLDYGIGNVHSVMKALEHSGAEVVLSKTRKELLEADGLVVPGVGAFAAVMQALAKVQGEEIIDQRLVRDRPVFGICVGFQILFSKGVEGETVSSGLEQWPGTVQKLQADPLPHIGWNKVQPGENSKLFESIAEERFYFVHSYAATNWELEVQAPFPVPSVSWSDYGQKFVAAVENGPLSGTQFHPEKSGRAGLKLLENWVSSI